MFSIKDKDGAEIRVHRDTEGVWITVNDGAYTDREEASVTLDVEAARDLLKELKRVLDVDA